MVRGRSTVARWPQNTAESQAESAPTRFTTRDESTSQPDCQEKVTRLLKLRWDRRMLQLSREQKVVEVVEGWRAG